jgi:hypothetical protein
MVRAHKSATHELAKVGAWECGAFNTRRWEWDLDRGKDGTSAGEERDQVIESRAEEWTGIRLKGKTRGRRSWGPDEEPRA